MSKYSPPPWSVNYGNDIHDSGSDIVAAIHGTTATQERANVALISAAPELLESLKLMVAIYRQSNRVSDEEDVIQEAIAVIKKAEGRS